MGILAFVLFWVAAGVAIFLVAMSGGRSSGKLLRTRRGRRLTYTSFAVVILALGVGIPVAVIVAKEENNTEPSSGVKLTPAEEHGRLLFSERCKNCHTLKAAAAVAQVGPDLDVLRPPKVLVEATIKSGVSRGHGQMAAELLQGQDVKDVSAFVAKSVGQP